MAGPTRDEFLSHVHQGLVHPETGSKKGSPTKSTQRYRWRELLSWDVEADGRAYWDTVDEDDKTAILPVAGYWGIALLQVDIDFEEFASEPGLRSPFNAAFKHPHNLAIRGASDEHAEMRSEGSNFVQRPIANADYFMVYDRKICGLIELKTWWKVTEAEIEEVRSDTAPLSGEHHGRLAIEQAYGYMCFDQVRYGIMATFNAFVFMKRENGGILYMSRTIPITATTPTILKLFYFFSHLCALHPEPYPETDSEGVPIHLRSAPKTPDKAPKIPDPDYQPPMRAGALAPPPR